MLLEEIKNGAVRSAIKEAMEQRSVARGLRDKADRIESAANDELETLILAVGDNTVSDASVGTVSLVENKPRKQLNQEMFKLTLAESGVSIDVITKAETKATVVTPPKTPVTVRYTPPKQ
uniref:Uncharacterized protein n=1 Tax=viral metagenome TaxID=1070528 RepID=A0A6M3JRQ2_9ZZZZ